MKKSGLKILRLSRVKLSLENQASETQCPSPVCHIALEIYCDY